MAIIDLKSHPFLRKIFGKTLWGDTDVCRTIDFQAGYGLHTVTNLSPLRSQIPGRLQRKNLLMSRSVSLHGVCPDHPPGKFARYRDLPSLSKQESSITWASAEEFQDQRLPMPTKNAIGAYMPNLLKVS
jgi:hypothetical protein